MYLVLGGKYKLLGSDWYLKVSTSYLDSTGYLGVSTSYKKELVLKLQITVLNTPLPASNLFNLYVPDSLGLLEILC